MENLTFFIKKVWLYAVVVFSTGFSITDALASGPSSTLLPAGTDPVIFEFNCIDGQPGDTICIPVTVQNFTSLLIAQFEIIWDSDVLDYIEVRNPATTAINTTADFNLSGPNALKFIPFGFDPFNGETLPDGTVLFEVCFRVIGIPGATSTISISPYFDFEVVALSGEVEADSIPCNMTVSNAVDLVGFVNSCGPAIAGGNGGIDVIAFGGSAPYTITWMETGSGSPGGPVVIPVEGGSMVLNVPTGNYNVTITDASGTSVTYNIDVDVVKLSLSTVIRHPTCYKFDNGTIWIKPGGGSAPYSYIWESLTDPTVAGSGFIRNAGDSSLVTSLPDGMYRILLKDDNGCEAIDTILLNDNPFVFTINGLQDASCNGAENGVIDISISGGTPDASGNYTVTIKPNFEVSTNSVSIGLLNPGTYSITVADEISQCDTVWSFTIGAANEITANVTTVDVLCAGQMNGQVSVRGLTNGVPGPTYSYTILDDMNSVVTSATGIGGTFIYSPLGPGNYAVVVHEGECASDTITFSISEPLPITVEIGGTTIDDCLTTPAQFATGTVWFDITNGMGPYILNAGAGMQDADTIRGLNAGNYTVTVTDANGCTATATFRIYDGDDNEKADITFQIDGIPCEGGTITLLYQGSTNLPPGSQVNWNNGNTGPTMTIEESDTLFVDLFLFTIHCMLNDTVIINCEEMLEIDVTVINPVCHEEALGGPYTGTVIVDTVFAVPPVSWTWSWGETTTTGTYTGLTPGQYYVTVTDGLDSMVVDSFEIEAPPAIHYNFTVIDSTSCAGECDGSITISAADGDPSLDYFLYWTNGTPQGDTGFFFFVEDLCAGITDFTITQDGVCFFPGSAEVFEPEPIQIDLVNAIDPTCFGDADGSIEVVASGGSPVYTYAWQGGPANATYSNLGEGEYFVSATDSEGCMVTDSFTLTQPDTLVLQVDSSSTLDLSCGATSDGVITVEVTGGNSGGYTFQWNPDVSTSYQAINLAPGNYFITVTDPKGCTDTTSYALTSPPPIIVEWPEIIPPLCFGDETVLLIDNVTGGSGNYFYSVNSGALLNIGEPVMIPGGIYIVSVVDDRGCSADSIYTVQEPDPILVSINPTDAIVDLGDSLLLTGIIDQSDTTIAMTVWSSADPVSCDTCFSTWVFNVLPSVYTWTVTDVNGCQGSSSIMVNVDFDRDVFIPNVFTPNNDGRNDEFRVYTGLGVKTINYIHIFDRWGNLVHSETNLLPSASGAGSWDGTFDGDVLNPGVYVYVAEVEFIDNDTRLVFRGDVTIIK